MTREFTIWAVIGLMAITHNVWVAGQESKSNTDVEKPGNLADLKQQQARLFWAVQSSKTKAVFATVTSYALSTCFSVTNTPACVGRKRRNVALDTTNIQLHNPALSSSLDEGEAPAERSEPSASVEKDPFKQGGGKKLTFWNTIMSTYTLTSVFYYPGTTVTVSARCSVPGLGASCFG